MQDSEKWEKLMGLTCSSVGKNASQDVSSKDSVLPFVCALAGPPNVGKSSLFNALTGMDQHTGNWTGKTVALAIGSSQKENITFVDLPGTYSLRAHSPEEEIARDYIGSDMANTVCVVCDAVNPERGLSLALQVLELTTSVVLCINLTDEAKKRGITVNCEKLSSILGVPAVPVSAKKKQGLTKLCEAIRNTASAEQDSPCPLTYPPEIETEIAELTNKGYTRSQIIGAWLEDKPKICDIEESRQRLEKGNPDGLRNKLVSRPQIIAEAIVNRTVTGRGNIGYSKKDRAIDRVVTHRILSVPLMLFMLFGIFWLTVSGSNYPSALLQTAFDKIENWLFLISEPIPQFWREFLILGALRTLFRVVAVMLPPMAIFFPLFTLLEDFGLLGRIAFNLDGAFSKAHACGKQSLTMCMGLGCNAAGVVGCRIIDSPRERLIAILTNSFVPCNGRFPILITVSSLLFAGHMGGFGAALVLTAVIILSTAVTLAVSKLLSLTVLKGEKSYFALELPSYRAPNAIKVIVRSIFDRTVFVLGRAAAVALPAGAVIWLLANLDFRGVTVLQSICEILNPLGRVLGLDGVILCAFILGFPANEIVLPLALMCYTSSGVLGTDAGIDAVLAANGWTAVTYINMIIMTVFHFPCSTTVLTVRRETGSTWYALLSMALPAVIGMLICTAVNIIFSLI